MSNTRLNSTLKNQVKLDQHLYVTTQSALLSLLSSETERNDTKRISTLSNRILDHLTEQRINITLPNSLRGISKKDYGIFEGFMTTRCLLMTTFVIFKIEIDQTVEHIKDHYDYLVKIEKSIDISQKKSLSILIQKWANILGSAYIVRNEYELGMRFYSKAADRFANFQIPTSSYALNYLRLNLLSTNDHFNAERWPGIGLYYLHSNRVDDAIKHIEQVPKKMWNSCLYLQFLNKMFTVYLNKKRFDKALSVLDEINASRNTYTENVLNLRFDLLLTPKLIHDVRTKHFLQLKDAIYNSINSQNNGWSIEDGFDSQRDSIICIKNKYANAKVSISAISFGYFTDDKALKKNIADCLKQNALKTHSGDFSTPINVVALNRIIKLIDETAIRNRYDTETTRVYEHNRQLAHEIINNKEVKITESRPEDVITRKEKIKTRPRDQMEVQVDVTNNNSPPSVTVNNVTYPVNALPDNMFIFESNLFATSMIGILDVSADDNKIDDITLQKFKDVARRGKVVGSHGQGIKFTKDKEWPFKIKPSECPHRLFGKRSDSAVYQSSDESELNIPVYTFNRVVKDH